MIAKFNFARLIRKASRQGDVPVLRRADSHPDAPARRPIRAAEDLGQPLPMSMALPMKRPIAKPEALDLPVDLETPLAALDPSAIPATPREPVRPVAPLAARPQIIEPGERFETFELTPIKRGGPTTAAAPTLRSDAKPVDAPVSVGSLLDRLEKRTGRNIRPGASIEETLGILRRLATQ